MKIRADIAELVRAGHSDSHIAHRLHCHPSTVNRVRQALRLPPAQVLGRLYAEEIPTGQVEDYSRRSQPISEAQAAANRGALKEAISAKLPRRGRSVQGNPSVIGREYRMMDSQ